MMNEHKVVVIVLNDEGKPVDSFGPFSNEESANEWLDENEHQFDNEEVVVVPCTSEEDDLEGDELEEIEEIEGDEISEEDDEEENEGETRRKIRRYEDEDEDYEEEEDEDLEDELEDYEEDEDEDYEGEDEDFDYDEEDEDTLDESAPAPAAPAPTKPAPVKPEKPAPVNPEREEPIQNPTPEENPIPKEYETPVPLPGGEEFDASRPRRLPPLPGGSSDLDEGILNRAMARGRGVLDSIGTLGKNIGSAGKAVFKGTGKKPLHLDAPAGAYKTGKIKSIASSSAKDLLNDWSKLGLIRNPSSQDIEELTKIFIDILSYEPKKRPPTPTSPKKPSNKGPKRPNTGGSGSKNKNIGSGSKNKNLSSMYKKNVVSKNDEDYYNDYEN